MRMQKILFFFMLLILLCSPAYAIGLRGSSLKETIYFVPGYAASFNYYIFANAGFTQDYELYIRMYDNTAGVDLTPYFTIDKYYIEDVPTGSQVPFVVTVAFPEELPELSPGMYELRAGARETETSQGGAFGVRTASEVRYFVIVLDDGPYAVVSFSAKNANADETSEMVFNVKNWGKPDITAQGKVRVYDAGNAMVGTASTAAETVQSTESSELKAYFSTAGLKPATYTAKAELSYTNNSVELESTFRVGSLNVDILGITNSFRKDAINKFNVKIRSGWNDEIENVYAEVSIKKNGEQIKQFQTVSSSLKPWETKDLLGYFDTEGLEYGEYEAAVTLNYMGSSSSKTEQIVIEQESAAELAEHFEETPGFFSITTLLLAIIVLLLVLIVIISIKIFRK